MCGENEMFTEKDEWYHAFCESMGVAENELSRAQKIPLHIVKKFSKAQFEEDKTERIWATDVPDIFLKKSECRWDFFTRCAEEGTFEKIDARWVKDDICTDEPYLWTERKFFIIDAIDFFSDYVSDNDIYECRMNLTIETDATTLINRGAELGEVLGRVGITYFKVVIIGGGELVQVSKI